MRRNIPSKPETAGTVPRLHTTESKDTHTHRCPLSLLIEVYSISCNPGLKSDTSVGTDN